MHNPRRGFIVAANQAGDRRASTRTGSPPTGTTATARSGSATSCTEKIADGEKLDAADMTTMQIDTTQRDRRRAGAEPARGAAGRRRHRGDPAVHRRGRAAAARTGTTPRTAPTRRPAAAAYFNAVWRNLLRLTFHDQLPDVDPRPTAADRWFEVVRDLLADKDNPWWDDASHADRHRARDEVLGQALKDARLELTAELGKDPASWEWGRLHRLQLEQQPLGGDGIPAPVRALFNRGTVPDGRRRRDRATPPAGTPPSGLRRRRLGAVDADGGRPRRPRPVHAGSTSPASPATRASAHYGDQTDAWAAGETYPWPFGRRRSSDAAERHPDAADPRPARRWLAQTASPARRGDHGVDAAVVRLHGTSPAATPRRRAPPRPAAVPPGAARSGQRAVVAAAAPPEPARRRDHRERRAAATASPPRRRSAAPSRAAGSGSGQPQAAGQRPPQARAPVVRRPVQVVVRPTHRQQHPDPALRAARPQQRQVRLAAHARRRPSTVPPAGVEQLRRAGAAGGRARSRRCDVVAVRGGRRPAPDAARCAQRRTSRRPAC